MQSAIDCLRRRLSGLWHNLNRSARPPHTQTPPRQELNRNYTRSATGTRRHDGNARANSSAVAGFITGNDSFDADRRHRPST